MLDGAWLCPLNPLDELDELDDLLEELVLLDDFPDEEVEEVLEDLLLLDDDVAMLIPPVSSGCSPQGYFALRTTIRHSSAAHYLPASRGP